MHVCKQNVNKNKKNIYLENTELLGLKAPLKPHRHDPCRSFTKKTGEQNFIYFDSGNKHAE